jgi:hypothetical protein
MTERKAWWGGIVLTIVIGVLPYIVPPDKLQIVDWYRNWPPGLRPWPWIAVLAIIFQLQLARLNLSQHPDISGVWEEIPGINVIVAQDDGHFKAEVSYLQNGSTVKWEMRGTITKEGAIEGVLAHTQPAGLASQTRRAKLAEDAKTIKGYADFHGGGGHEWTWTKLYVKRGQ